MLIILPIKAFSWWENFWENFFIKNFLIHIFRKYLLSCKIFFNKFALYCIIYKIVHLTHTKLPFIPRDRNWASEKRHFELRAPNIKQIFSVASHRSYTERVIFYRNKGENLVRISNVNIYSMYIEYIHTKTIHIQDVHCKIIWNI